MCNPYAFSLAVDSLFLNFLHIIDCLKGQNLFGPDFRPTLAYKSAAKGSVIPIIILKYCAKPWAERSYPSVFAFYLLE